MATASEKRCHYEVLGLSRDCAPEEIRSAYKKLALQRHPDKLVQSGVSQADATAQFQELAQAYEVLSDPKERAWYDSHRSQILFSDANSSVSNSPIPNLFSFFSNTVFSGYSDTGKGFYKVYSDVFDKIYGNEINYARKMGSGLDSIREAPVMGNLESPYTQVTAFYNYWLGFCTVMDFGWVDMYDAAAGVNRKSRRVMEEENKKLRKKARREYNDTVRGLAEFVKKRDKRVVDMMMKRNKENEKKREEERERKKKLEKERLERARAYEEPEWARVEEEEAEENELFGDGDDDIRMEEKEFYCVVCGKKFKSEKQWQNHEKSKKHKEKVAALKDSFVEEDELINGGQSDGIDEIEERIREDLDIEEEEVESEDGTKEPLDEMDSDEFAEVEEGKIAKEDLAAEGENGLNGEDRFFDIDESDGGEVGKGDVGSSGGDNEEDVDEITVLEAMLSGRRNRRKAALEQERKAANTINQNGGENSEFMEYDNRKGTRKNRGGRKDKSRKNKGEAVVVDRDDATTRSDEANGFANSNNEPFVPHSSAVHEDRSTVDNGAAENHKKEKVTGKKDAKDTKSKNTPKGRKAKASSKNAENLCEMCGEEFDSRNKLHQHLGETGHATLKFRR